MDDDSDPYWSFCRPCTSSNCLHSRRHGMRLSRILMTVALTALGSVGAGAGAHAQTYAPGLFSQMRWRPIGPLRGGRGRAVAGVPSEPNVFYIGNDDGGVWKSTDE